MTNAKQANKSTRKPVTQGDGKGKLANKTTLRRALGSGLKLDATAYEAKYPDKKLRWVNDVDAELGNWLAAGAEYVPKIVADGSDRSEGNVIVKHAGETIVLLMYSLEIDAELKAIRREDAIAPMKQMVQKAKAGSDTSQQGDSADTYAPTLPTGDTGLGMGISEYE